MNPFENRKYFIIGIIILVSLVYLVRLFYIQIIDFKYKYSADNNSMRYVTQYPARGLIYDRNGELIVENVAAYDLMVIPNQVKAFDTLKLVNTINADYKSFVKELKRAKKISGYRPYLMVKQISQETYTKLAEKLFEFPGFYTQTRTLRKYPYKIAANVLGYIGEVDGKTIEKDQYYKMGDYIGISGIEKSYEKELRGQKGVKIYLVDVHNRVVGSYADGKKDTLPKVGRDIMLTIDASLQAYGEKLMKNKVGSIVAIEPLTGEILCMVTSPSYDPNLLVGRIRSRNYRMLRNDSLHPLFDRTTQAQYPPGSIFKLVQGAIGLQEGIITKDMNIAVEPYPNMNDHAPAGIYDVKKAIVYSSNWFFAKLFYRMIHRGLSTNRYKDAELGFRVWYSHVISFGFGKKLQSDILREKSGFIPTVEYYDKYYGDNRWKGSNIISLAIGQGEIQVIPLQMANLACIVSNKGYYYIPHLIKGIGKTDSIPVIFKRKQFTTVDSTYFNVIKDAAEEVVKSGTGQLAAIKDIVVCGKTGTAQNPHGEDHSVFVAFAPKDKPKIAVAVYIENAGFGGVWSAPVASLIIEKYLKGAITNKYKEQRILKKDFIHGNKP